MIAPPMFAYRYVEENGSTAILAAKRLAGVAPEVNLKECVTHMPLSATYKAAHSGFETQRKHHQKSKTGVSVAHNKRLMSSKYLKRTLRENCKQVKYPSRREWHPELFHETGIEDSRWIYVCILLNLLY